MEEVYEFIGKKLKLTEADTVVIGVSGGPDSMALLYIMNQFKEKIGFKIICAHVNHNKRPESEKEQKCLEKYCKENNIILIVDEMYASIVPKISKNIKGIISKEGSPLSHASILLKSINIPYIIYKDALKLDNKKLTIDTKSFNISYN